MLQRGRYVALADYCAVGNSEVNMRDGDIVELLKVGCAGWWYVKVIGMLLLFKTKTKQLQTFFSQVVQLRVGHRHHI